jgi:RNA polymerase sigma factor (sigma-70 family)
MQSYSDPELLANIKAGGSACERAMEFLYKKHIDSIISFITARNGTREEGKDIFQDAVIQLLINVQQGTFQGNSALSTYLFAISKNLWYRRFSKARREEQYATQMVPMTADSKDPEMILMTEDQQEHVRNLMDGLKPKCKEVLLLWGSKFSMKEIADKLGYNNEQVVRNKKNLCLKELKERLGKQPALRQWINEMVS